MVFRHPGLEHYQRLIEAAGGGGAGDRWLGSEGSEAVKEIVELVGSSPF